jgi:hypothetical protein
MGKPPESKLMRTAAICCIAAWVVACSGAAAQTPPGGQLKEVTVTSTASAKTVEKSFRTMIRGLDYFEQHRAQVPAAALRFKLLPRRADTRMDAITVEVAGKQVDYFVPVAADRSFAIERNRQAYDEDAQIIIDRKLQSATWRIDIRSPGVPANARRLGDLRLECQVGFAAGLVSNSPSFLDSLAEMLETTPGYCDTRDPRYLFFADRAIFGVTLASGSRREAVPVSRLYAGASETPDLKVKLPYCDCEVLLDRTYFVPLHDRSWPDDTLVELEYMEDAP